MLMLLFSTLCIVLYLWNIFYSPLCIWFYCTVQNFIVYQFRHNFDTYIGLMLLCELQKWPQFCVSWRGFLFIKTHLQCGLMLFINMFLSFLFRSKDPDFINAERLRLHAARIKKKAATKKHNKGKSKKVAFQANRREK